MLSPVHAVESLTTKPMIFEAFLLANDNIVLTFCIPSTRVYYQSRNTNIASYTNLHS